ncbi:caveolin-2 [Girardinichthys multiradiatus]|uniref:caveolin-2 n=1 Tax=Girardinichthys multiradiatus TaxID=208333 RepID=UPI001FAC9D3A|nr:caveolin-2 [Girardinichthys multiradiatus]
MGVEKEKLDTSIIMDEDEFNRSIEPILSKKGKVYPAAQDRDPNEINTHLKVSFEDVIGEPISTHSFDKVWIGSHATFELVKFFFYRLLTTLLAVPMAFILGLIFGVLSCAHIWLVMPMIQSFMMLLPSAQKIWRSLMDILITPLFHSLGKCLSSIQVQMTESDADTPLSPGRRYLL